MSSPSEPSPAGGEPAAEALEAIIDRASGLDLRDRARLRDAVAELRASEARYRSLVETSVQVVWRADSAGRLFDRLARWSAVTGVPVERLPAEPLDMVHPDDRPHGTRQWWDAVARREPLSFEQRVRWAGGGYRFWQVRGAPVLDPDGRVREWIGADTDITERKRAEGHLRQLNQVSLALNAAATREEVLRLVADEARELIGAHRALASVGDGQGHAQPTGHESRSGEGGSVVDISGLLALASRMAAPLRLSRVALAGDPALADDPPRGWLSTPLAGRDGQPIGVLALADRYEDEFSEADEALLQQLAQLAAVAIENRALYEQERAARAAAEEASRLKDEFLATVSHELRTPLTAFLGYAQMLQMRKRDETYVALTVEKMVRSARAQAQLIDDLLDVSRIVSGMLRIDAQPIDLAGVVRAALETVRPAVEAKGLLLDVALSPATAVVGDAGRLQQVVWNLLSNAVKFTPAGGTIRVALARERGAAQLSVSDSGQGIAPEFLPFVFDRFRQADSTSRRRQGGLGLGLAIVRHLVELHGGVAQAASAGEGRGATFIVRLPLAGQPGAGASPALAEPIPAGAPALRGMRVLLVDDQPDLLEVLGEFLTLGGAVVRTAARATVALELLRAWRPDVLVSDLAMPDEDGYWLVRQLRALPAAEGGATPAIALTASVREEDQAAALAAGFQRYLPKPVEAEALCAAVAALASG